MPINPYEKYKQQAVMTMTQGEMLLKLYDEIIRQVNLGIIYIDENNIYKRNKALQKAQKIVNHLRTTLNFAIEISNNLDSLYDFFNYQILQANLKNDKKFLVDVLPMITELRDAFEQAEKSTRS